MGGTDPQCQRETLSELSPRGGFDFVSREEIKPVMKAESIPAWGQEEFKDVQEASFCC